MKTKSKSDLRNEAESICGCIHTPGPWQALISGATRAISTTNGAPKQATICRLFTECASFAPGEPEANARLIAAAPELLEALQSIADGDNQPVRILQQWARAAIAKATGGAE